jgi:hypothetical protein
MTSSSGLIKPLTNEGRAIAWNDVAMTTDDGETRNIPDASIKIIERHRAYEAGIQRPMHKTWRLVWPGHRETRRRDRKTQTRRLEHRFFSRPVDEEVARVLFTLTVAKDVCLLLGEDTSHQGTKGQLGIDSLNIHSDGGSKGKGGHDPICSV